MKTYTAADIRNVALLGHSGSGKTSLAEAALFLAGATARLGSVIEKNTVCDYEPEEIKRGVSVSAALAPAEWQGRKINLIDAPGLFDFEGEQIEAMRAADSAVIVVSAKAGIEPGCEKAWEKLEACRLPRAFFVNKLDDDKTDFYKILTALKAAFGPSVCPVVVPFREKDGGLSYINLIEGKAYRYGGNGKRVDTTMPDSGYRIEGLAAAISEAVAETDEGLFDKYFSGERFSTEEILNGIHFGIRDGSISPVYCGSATELEGVDLLLNSLAGAFPGADESLSEYAVSENAPAAAVVFKTTADPFVGKLSYLKVECGRLTPDTPLVNQRTGQIEKAGRIFMLRGKKQTELTQLCAGDIGAVSKMASPLTGDTLSAGGTMTLEGIDFPEPCYSMAVHANSNGDEDKLSQGLRRLTEEDPTFLNRVEPETREQLVSGLSEQHLDTMISKLKSKFGVGVSLSVPKIPFRETIRKKVKAEGKYKKQTGGHGQFGHVFIEFEPCDGVELAFEEKVFGGSVPKNYFPAVEKGLRESAAHGVLAGCPVVNVKATLVDGSYHPVDSSEMSFKVAASLAFKAGMEQASPVLLEPVGLLKVFAPAAGMGEITGSINRRRGRVTGMGGEQSGRQFIEAEVPFSEMHDFAASLRAAARGRGSFTFRFLRYEEAPPAVAQKIIEQNTKRAAAQ